MSADNDDQGRGLDDTGTRSSDEWKHRFPPTREPDEVTARALREMDEKAAAARKENAERHSALIAEAKQNAPPDKAPFDFDELSKYHRDACDLGPRVSISDYPQAVQNDERVRAEEYYWLKKPELKTMKELGEYLTYLDSW